MRLKEYIVEDIISKALSLPEPEVGEKYPSEKVKRYIDLIDQALSDMKKKEENDSNDAIVADLRDKKKKWSNVDKETKPAKTAPSEPPAEKEPPPEQDQKVPPEDRPLDEPKNEPEATHKEIGPEAPAKKKKKVREDYEEFLRTPFEKMMRK